MAHLIPFRLPRFASAALLALILATAALTLIGCKSSAATTQSGESVDADGVVHIPADTLIAKHPRMRELCTIAEQCANVHITAELVDSTKADRVIRGYTIVHIQSGLAPTGNNANSDAEYEAEAKANPLAQN